MWDAPDSEERSEEGLRESYNAMFVLKKEQIKEQAINGLIKIFGWMIIPLPVFILTSDASKRIDIIWLSSR